MRKIVTSPIALLLMPFVILIIGCSVQDQVMQKEQFEAQKSAESPDFIAFDVAPQPRGGLKVLQEKVYYPEMMQETGREGKSVVSVVIDATGAVKKVSIVSSAGNKAFDEAAIYAVKNTTWLPAQKAGLAVTTQVSVPILFKLHKDEKEKVESSEKPE